MRKEYARSGCQSAIKRLRIELELVPLGGGGGMFVSQKIWILIDSVAIL